MHCHRYYCYEYDEPFEGNFWLYSSGLAHNHIGGTDFNNCDQLNVTTNLSMIWYLSRFNVRDTNVRDETDTQNHHSAIGRHNCFRYCRHTHCVSADLKYIV